MGFLDKIFGRGSEKLPEKSSLPSMSIPQPESITTTPEKKAESIADYMVDIDGDRTILYIPGDKARQIGGQEGVKKLYRELCKGAYPFWANDYGNAYAVEMPSRFRFPDTAAKIEEFKRTIDERAKKK